MEITLQQIFVSGIIASSVLYLAGFYWKKHKSKSGCASCKLVKAAQPKSTKAIKE